MYIDPPYNTEHAAKDGNGVADDKENKQSKKFIYRDKFSRNGWLNMMQERLVLAHKLLKEDGVIFVSIDDNEQAYLKVLMDEVFGEENFVASIKWKKTKKPSGNTNVNKYLIDIQHEYIHCFAKNKANINLNYHVYSDEESKEKDYLLKDEWFEERGYYKLTPLWRTNSGSTFQYQKSLDYPIEAPDGSIITIWRNENKPDHEKMRYTWSKRVFDVGQKLGFIEYVKEKNGKWSVYRKIYEKVKFDTKNLVIKEVQNGVAYTDYYDDKTTDSSAGTLRSINLSFSFSKPYELIKHLLNIVKNKNSRVLDFFAGSGTTAHAVMDLNQEDDGNRTFTLVTNNENDIGYGVTYERLYRVSQGKGTNGESFDWLKKNDPYNIGFNIYDVKQMDLSISGDKDIKEFESNIVKMLKDFGLEKPEEIELIKLRALKSLSNN
nr:site-specific DNA-methyltransferase [Mycoplasma bradburyae]